MLDQFFGVDGVEVVSLSHPWVPGRVCHYPGDPEYQLQAVATLETEGYALNYVSVGEHTGTHWGAPCHFNKGETTADELDPEDFFLPGVVIDIQRQAQKDSDYAASVDDLEAWQSRYGQFPKQCAVILNTGWHKRWPTERFTNLDKGGIPRHPGFSLDAVRWLLRQEALGYRGHWAPTLSALTSVLTKLSPSPNSFTGSIVLASKFWRISTGSPERVLACCRRIRQYRRHWLAGNRLRPPAQSLTF